MGETHAHSALNFVCFSWSLPALISHGRRGEEGFLRLFLKPATLPWVVTWLQPRCLQKNFNLRHLYSVRDTHSCWCPRVPCTAFAVTAGTSNDCLLLHSERCHSFADWARSWHDERNNTSWFGCSPFWSGLVPHFETAQRWRYHCCWVRRADVKVLIRDFYSGGVLRALRVFLVRFFFLVSWSGEGWSSVFATTPNGLKCVIKWNTRIIPKIFSAMNTCSMQL